MKRTCANACTCWHSYHYIRILLPAVMNFCKIIDDLIEAYRYKICELHFHYAFEIPEAQSEARSDDRAFAQWRVAHTFFPKFVYKSFRYFKRAAIFRNILPH